MTPVKTDKKENRQSYYAFREQSKRRARHKKAIQSTRSKIADREKLLHQLEEDINENIPSSDWEKLQEVSEQKRRVENDILELYVELEQLEAEDVD